MSSKAPRLSSRTAPPSRQGGAIIVLIAIAMLAILAMGGLALDGSHMFLNKARLQNSVDSAALAAAKVLDQTGDEARARTAVASLLGLNAQAAGNQELNGSLSGGGLNVTVEFSRTLQPFSPGTSPAEYVRVRALNFQMPAWLIPVDFTYIPVLSDPLPDDAWPGRNGFAHQAVLDDFADLSGYQVYVCGAPAMVDAARKSFIETRNLPAEDFFADSFTYAAQPQP
jgi:hypothetical protein